MRFGRHLLIARVLLIACGVIAAYLAWVAVSGGGVVGCGGPIGCGNVLASKWAYWFQIPVSFLALANYGGLLLLTSHWWPKQGLFGTTQTRWLLVGISAVATVGAALWFAALQFWVLRSFCGYCMTAHVLGLIAALILLNEVRTQRAADPVVPRASVWIGSGYRGILIGGVSGLLLLIGGQVGGQRLLYKLKSGPSDGSLYVISGAPADRTISLHDNQLQLEIAQWPVIGPVQARSYLLSFFDYTCSHCREMHPKLVAVQKRFGHRLAIVSLPTPMDAGCNSAVAATVSPHENACLFARIALAIRLVDTEKFRAFDEWMFSLATIPSAAEVERYARDLIGADRLNQALRDPRVAQQITLATRAYELNRWKFNQPAMPQLLIGRAFVAGKVPTVDRLEEIIREHLKPPE